MLEDIFGFETFARRLRFRYKNEYIEYVDNIESAEDIVVEMITE